MQMEIPSPRAIISASGWSCHPHLELTVRREGLADTKRCDSIVQLVKLRDVLQSRLLELNKIHLDRVQLSFATYPFAANTSRLRSIPEAMIRSQVYF